MLKKTHAVASDNTSIISSVAVGVATGIGLAILLTMALTSLVASGSVDENRTMAFIFAIRGIGGFAAAALATVVAKRQYLMVIGITAGAYLLSIIASGIVFFDGRFVHFGNGLLSVLLGCSVACILRLKPPSKKKHKAYRV